MSRPVLVFIHAPWETPALIGTALAGIASVHRTIIEEPAPNLPPVKDLGGLVVMGGPQDANDDARYPGLRVERRLIAEAVEVGVPVLGVCLGMQLLGLALGAKLHLQHGREVGFAPVHLTAQAALDPVLEPFSRAGSPTVLHWHSDAIELPAGATLLASTALTPVQAFRFGSAPRPAVPPPSWPRHRILELAPAYWKQTLEQPETQQKLAANAFRRVLLALPS
jgi:GMP synthase (glutamine-hydrolysing)